MPEIHDRPLRPDSVAKILDCSKSEIYALVVEGHLIAHCKDGKRSKPIRIVASSVEDYMQKFRVEPEQWLE